MLNNYFWRFFDFLIFVVSVTMNCFHFALILNLSYNILQIFSAVKHPISIIYDDIPFPTSQFVKSLEISILLEIIFFHGFLLLSGPQLMCIFYFDNPIIKIMPAPKREYYLYFFSLNRKNNL